MRECIFIFTGPVDYGEMLETQRELAALRNSGKIEDVVIFTSHEDVFTLGSHDTLAQDAPAGYPSFRVERGGGWTYHGPGQLVIYFIINLRDLGFTVLDLIKVIGRSVTDFLLSLGINGELKLGRETGIWVEGKKICSIGLGVKEFTTIHGIAFNVDTDLQKFSLIKPCGFDSSIMTSLANVKGKIDMESVLAGIEESIVKNLELDKVKKINGMEKANDLIRSMDNCL